jgi:hypothetical protein
VKDAKFGRKRQKEERKRKIVVKVYERRKNVGKKAEGREEIQSVVLRVRKIISSEYGFQ